MKIKVIVVFALIMAKSLTAQDETVFKTYPLANPDTNTIVEVVKAIVGEKGKVFLYNAGTIELIVSATSNQHSQISTLLKELNVPAQNVKIDVVFVQATRQEDHLVDLAGKGRTKTAKGKTALHLDLNPTIQSQSKISSDDSSQSVVVKRGMQADIFMGQEVPFYQWLIDFGLQWNYINTIEQKFEMKKVGSALRVEPRVMAGGSVISVKITPELTGLVDGRPHKIQYTGLTTEVFVKNGEQAQIGSFGKNKEFSDKFLAGAGRGGTHQSVQIKLTASIMTPQGAPTTK